MKKFSWRGLSIIIFILVTAFYLAPLAIPNLPGWWSQHTLKLGLDLKGGMQILLEVDTSQLSAADARGAVDQNIKIIRERIDQFGVAEPSIQKLGEKRIMVQLPGVSDFQAAENLIKQTAMLEFKVVAQPDEARRILDTIDANITANIDKFPALNELDELDKQILAESDSLEQDSKSGVFNSLIRPGEMDYEVQYDSVRLIQNLMADSLFHQMIPAGWDLSLERAVSGAPREDRTLHVLSSAVQLSGNDLARAKVEYGSSTSTDPRIANKPYISIEMKREGARKFERVTADNVGKRLAIVLDDVVYSAPNIQERIGGGRAQITGRFTSAEANELAIVLNTGNLIAPIKPVSTSIIGATLGSDSIRSGSLAGMVGLAIVMLFMIFYYKLSGLITDLALIFNVGFVLAILTAFGGTLTLPGIAGIILTIGMAVDANVLVFERIREELDTGKTPRSAVDSGYKRATITVWDANITTLIAAAVLYQFGTGPIRGFAITLTIGIIGSMFCALVFVRSIFDTFVVTGTKKTLSI
ncbi:MAG: protein translocase subunit SecD [Candidatus Cloacimonadaceae bacterium]|jgi:protein-export membrane protein SecD|nr:protein translocase subunit SecD [Candidatus Cloacimonadota bacterium]MCB5254787.1 protein translocase subunit SecD [Candidatus Cloacimonadota bacterium]MCK9178486.1 protein translocase subunit SecD [Candidatus Cloacimonadota bacterium]MCK9243351.1 protein translocase subunit SecD [Candidatus Cloacimonadota bacterium]MDY0128172.1 protein translocase subunit SecD [Candidatus Cloacimonadaceae bacterium]